MQKNLETYVNKVFGQAKNFLQKNFPEVYKDIGIKIGVKNEKGKPKYDYVMAYNPRIKMILLKNYEYSEAPKDYDIITNAFGIKMRRKNSYLISIIHELGEAMYLKGLGDSVITYYDLDVSHNVAVNLEMHALEKLIGQSSREDKEDFVRRKKARIKDMRKYKLKGV